MAKTYEAMQRATIPSSTGWRFLDLKNRRQIGDLEKKILQFKQKNEFKIFNFSSAREKEGVSTILTNLVAYLKNQDSEEKILVIDANFNTPSIDTIFNVHHVKGLSDVLMGDLELKDSLVHIDNSNISILTSGNRSEGLSGNLSYEKLTTILDACKNQYDTILFDSAPVLTSPDALSIALHSDVTFLVIQSLKVQKEVALRTKLLLHDNECVIGGVILNRVSQAIPGWIYRFI